MASAMYGGTFATEQAEAGVVHFPAPGNSFTVQAGNTLRDWDIDGGGANDFQVELNSFVTVLPTTTLVTSTLYVRSNGGLLGRGFVRQGADLAPTLRNLAFGSTIGPTLGGGLVFGDSQTQRALVQNVGGSVTTPFAAGFTGGTSDYVGFKFLIGADTHYGWARVQLDTIPGLALTVFEWAYNNNPGIELTVGQTTGGDPPSGVPEPASAALAGGLAALAAGAAGIQRWRRRKRLGTPAGSQT